MPLVRCTVTLRMDSGILEDFPTNTWWFDDDDGTTEPAIETELIGFYDSVRPYFPTSMEQNGHTFEWYRESDPPPRAPIRTTVWNLTSNPSGTPLPSEVALCCSFQADRISGVPQARRRGRVYIGPLSTVALGTDGRPAATFVTAMVNAGNDLVDASVASTTWKWSVFSRVLGTGSEVTNGWVDNAFDTQRRRGIAPSARTVFL